MCRCLYCYKPLSEGEKDFHPRCARAFFGSSAVPVIEWKTEDMDSLATKIIRDKTSLTGVQPKLSLNLNIHSGSGRLTIVGVWGNYICKPQTAQYELLPEIEDLTMHLAEIANIRVVPHTLMRMADGTLCYITKRIDRTERGEKIHMEDMCQLSGRLTEHKYRSSYERVGKIIANYSHVPKMDLIDFFEVVLFSFLTGNNDMHLKNFSLLEPGDGKNRLCAAYDLVNAAIVNPRDNEQLALTLNGRKRNLSEADFLSAGETMGIDRKVTMRLILKFAALLSKFHQMVDQSFLSDGLKEKYHKLLSERMNSL